MIVIRFRSIVIYMAALAVILCTGHFYRLNINGVPANAEEKSGIVLPILMYHGITEDENKVSKYVISAEMLEEDFKYITEKGYNTVTVDEVIRYVKEGGDLPEKPLMLTFDDGYYNNYCYAYPLLKKYNLKAVISIIGRFTDFYTELEEENPAYSHITWTEVTEMMESGLVEFQNHSYNLHSVDKGRSGAKKKRGETDEEYKKFLKEDLCLLQDKMQENTGYTPTTFTYPFGGISNSSYEILDEIGFQATLSCEEKLNYILKGDESCLKCMDRFLRSNKVSAEAILEKSIK